MFDLLERIKDRMNVLIYIHDPGVNEALDTLVINDDRYE